MRKWLEYIPFILIATIVRFLPRSTALGLGKSLGRITKYLQSRRANIAKENLGKAFPEMSAEEVTDVVTRMFEHLGINSIDMLRLDKYRGMPDFESYFTAQGKEYIDEALSLGRGCIVLTGHVGFWEAGAFIFPLFGFNTAVVAKPMRNTLVDDFLSRMRQSGGNYIINSRKGARSIIKSLQKNHLVCILTDQHLKGKGSVSVPFFGRPAHTTTIITQMAAKRQIPIVTAFSYRLPDNRCECVVKEMILLNDDMTDEGVRNNTALLNQKLEDAIQHDISQWFWLHRRWRRCCERDAV